MAACGGHPQSQATRIERETKCQTITYELAFGGKEATFSETGELLEEEVAGHNAEDGD